MNIKTTITQYGDAKRVLRDALDRVARPREVVRKTANVIADSIIMNILQSRTPEGDSFDQLKRVRMGLSPRTGKHGQDPRPLIDHGTLVESIGYKILDDYGRSAVAGHTGPGEIPYGVYQNFGIPSANVPARRFVGVRDGDLDNITQMVGEFVLGEIRAAVSSGSVEKVA